MSDLPRYYRCKSHGLFELRGWVTPGAPYEDWTPEAGCPCVTYQEEPCGLPIRPEALAPTPDADEVMVRRDDAEMAARTWEIFAPVCEEAQAAARRIRSALGGDDG